MACDTIAEVGSELGPVGLATLTPGRARLVEANRGLAKSIAVKVAYRNGVGDIDDFEGEAYVGLTDAARSFDPAKGMKFATFAAHRAWGQIQDYLRGQMPQGSRREYGRKALGGVPQIVSINVAVTSDDGARSAEDLDIVAEAEDRGDDGSGYHELMDDLFRTLPANHRRMMAALYGNAGTTMKSVGASIGLSESRVSQMHSEAVELIRLRYPTWSDVPITRRRRSLRDPVRSVVA